MAEARMAFPADRYENKPSTAALTCGGRKVKLPDLHGTLLNLERLREFAGEKV